MSAAGAPGKFYWKYPNPIPLDEDVQKIADAKKISVISGIFALVATASACGVYFATGSYFSLICVGASVPALVVLAIFLVKARQKPATVLKQPLESIASNDTESALHRTFKTVSANIDFQERIPQFQSTDNRPFHVIALKKKEKRFLDLTYKNHIQSTYTIGEGCDYKVNEAFFEFANPRLFEIVNDLASSELSAPASVLIFEQTGGPGCRVFFAKTSEPNTEQALVNYYNAIYLTFCELRTLVSNAKGRATIHIPVPFGLDISTRALVTLFIAASKNAIVDLIFYPNSEHPHENKEKLTDYLLTGLCKAFQNEKNARETIKRILLNQSIHSWVA